MASFVFTGELDSIPDELPFDYTIKIDKKGKLEWLRISNVWYVDNIWDDLNIPPLASVEYTDEWVRLVAD